MKSRLLEFARHGLVYGLGNVSQQLIGFLLLPAYTSRLLPEEYGLLNMLMTFSALLNVLLGMGFSTTLYRFFFEKEGKERKQVVSTVLIWLTGVAVLAILAISLAAGSISQSMFKTTQYALHLRLISITLAFNLIEVVPLIVLRAQRRSLHYVLLTISMFVLGILLNIYAVVVLEKGVLGILVAQGITGLVFVTVGLTLCREFIGLQLSKPLLGEMLHYTLPLIPGAVGGYILQRADRWFLQRYASLGVVGLYSLAYQFGSIVTILVIQPFQLVWSPTVMEMYKKNRSKELFERGLTYFFLIAGWVCLGVSLFSREVLTLMAKPAYLESQWYVPWIALSYMIYGAYLIVDMGIFLLKKTSYVVWIMGSAALANLLLNFLLIPSFSALGAAAATLISYGILFVIAYWINQRFFPLQYEWKRMGNIILAVLILMLAGLIIQIDNIYSSLAFKAILALAYWGLLYLFGFFQSKELEAIRSIMSGLLNKTMVHRKVGKS